MSYPIEGVSLPAAHLGGWYSHYQAMDLTIRQLVTDLASLSESAAATAASTPIICVWTGSAWTTLAGGSVPTDTALVRWYDSTPYSTAGVTDPTHYSALDKWFQKPGD
jgi:hypothetical protein